MSSVKEAYLSPFACYLDLLCNRISYLILSSKSISMFTTLAWRVISSDQVWSQPDKFTIGNLLSVHNNIAAHHVYSKLLKRLITKRFNNDARTYANNHYNQEIMKKSL